MKPEFWGIGAIGLAILAGLGIARFVGVGSPASETAMEMPIYESVEVGDLTISGYWVAESIGTAPRTAAYLTITDNSGTDERLLDVTTEAAGMASLHRTVTDGGTSRMEPVDGIIVPSGGEMALRPGGLHIMLTALPAPLVDGADVELTLEFLEHGEVTFTAPVRSRAEMMDTGMDHSSN